MAKEDVAKALQAMGNDGVRAKLAKGDFTDVSELDLSAEEQQLVRDAAGDYPDVAGFAFDAFMGTQSSGSGGGAGKVSFDALNAQFPKFGLAVSAFYKE